MRLNVHVCAVLLLTGMAVAACGQPLSDAEIRAKFAREPDKAAEYIADHNAFKGYTKAHVAAVLGSDGTGTYDRQNGLWTNGCSGDPGCYMLTIQYDRNGRVIRATKTNT